jgi:hypothetical protein
MSEASDALSQAEEVLDYQSVGMRCREALLAFADIAQKIIPWNSAGPKPKAGDLRAWADHICGVTMTGESHKERRHLFKTLLESAWTFANWLTHSKGSKWHDAEAAIATTENAITLCTSTVIRYMRGVPQTCPACDSHRLSPERGIRTDIPDVEWERPTCDKCDWKGEPVPVLDVPPDERAARRPPEGDCIIPTVPIKVLKKPAN